MVNVLIAGSYIESPTVTLDEFKSACEKVGQWLHKNDCKILVAATLPDYADHYILAGAISEFRRSNTQKSKILNVELFSATGDQTRQARKNLIFDQLFELQVSGVKINRFREPDYIIAFQNAIKAADIIILIGGGSNTSNIYTQALEMGKPIIGLSRFGGVGARAMNELRLVYKLAGISENDIYFLDQSVYGEEYLISLFHLLQNICDRNPWKKRETWRILPFFLMIGAVIALAVTVIVAVNKIPPPWGGRLFTWLFPIGALGGLIGGLFKVPYKLGLTNSFKYEILKHSGSGISLGFLSSSVIALIVSSIIDSSNLKDDMFVFTNIYLISACLSTLIGFLGFYKLPAIAELVERLPK